MAILSILTLGDPVLRTKARPVTVFDESLVTLAADMAETMADAPGVGLAAPQVGRSIRLFVYDDGDGDRGAVVNPEFLWFSEETEDMEEGCLSVPGMYFPVTRPARVRLRANTVAGETIEREAEGFVARIFQHETDHLDGILFIDRLAPEIRREAMKHLRDQDFGMAPTTRRPRAL